MLIGIDLGGTKIEAIALDGDGAELARQRVATPREDYRGTLHAIARLVEALEARFGPAAGIGAGTPGALSPATGRLRNANSVWLNGTAFDTDLAAVLGRPVRIANDANCFALSEATDGAGAGAPVVFGVILGTGVGGGLVVDGRVVTGRHAIAGEWGHNPMPGPTDDERPGPSCYCGRRGCIETLLAGPALERDHVARAGRRLAAAEIALAAEAGDATAEAVLRTYEDRLARALASVINVLDPHVIVLGGGVSNIARLYENVPARWSAHVFSDVVETRLARAVHGDSSGVRGAAWLGGDGELPTCGSGPA